MTDKRIGRQSPTTSFILPYQKTHGADAVGIYEPEKYCEQWQSLSEKHKEGIIKHWKKEKKNFEESIKNRVNEMERRSKQ